MTILLARRHNLQNIRATQADHAGLWFDKFLEKQLAAGTTITKAEQAPEQKLVEETAAIGEPPCYATYYQRWRAALVAVKAETREAVALGRLAVGLGDESVIETAVTLHHTYGVPLIPGSALKGLAASYARNYLDTTRWGKESQAYITLFGNTKEAGYVTFFDALYIPGSGPGRRPLHADVMTVHHPNYYNGKNAPADWDSPTPISFLAASGRFLLALAGPPAWVKTTFDILEKALLELGVGAKTSSGYGRLRLAETTATAAQPGTPPRTTAYVAAGPPPGYERGRVIKFGLGPNKSFGYLASARGGPDVFVHRSDLAGGLTTLVEGQQVFYRREESKKGPQAKDVRPAG